MLKGRFFNNNDVFWYYNQLILRRQLQGNDLLVFCLDTGSNYDTFSIALLHDYYESKPAKLGHTELGNCRIMSMVDNVPPELNNYKGCFTESSTVNVSGVLAGHIEKNKLKIHPGKFLLSDKVVNKITFNCHEVFPFEKYSSRLDAIVVASMTSGHEAILREYASFLLRSKGAIFICEKNRPIDIQGLRHVRPGVYVNN